MRSACRSWCRPLVDRRRRRDGDPRMVAQRAVSRRACGSAPSRRRAAPGRSRPWPRRPVTHSLLTGSVAFCQRSYSDADSVSNTPPAAAASLRAGSVVASNAMPICFDQSRPLFASITFFRSGGRLSYFAWFIAITKIELRHLRLARRVVERRTCVNSCSLIGGRRLPTAPSRRRSRPWRSPRAPAAAASAPA